MRLVIGRGVRGDVGWVCRGGEVKRGVVERFLGMRLVSRLRVCGGWGGGALGRLAADSGCWGMLLNRSSKGYAIGKERSVQRAV